MKLNVYLIGMLLVLSGKAAMGNDDLRQHLNPGDAVVRVEPPERYRRRQVYYRVSCEWRCYVPIMVIAGVGLAGIWAANEYWN